MSNNDTILHQQSPTILGPIISDNRQKINTNIIKPLQNHFENIVINSCLHSASAYLLLVNNISVKTQHK